MRPTLFTLAFSLISLLPLAAQDMPLSQILPADSEWELVAEGYEFTDGLEILFEQRPVIVREVPEADEEEAALVGQLDHE
jgi:hypothetical protein